MRMPLNLLCAGMLLCLLVACSPAAPLPTPTAVVPTPTWLPTPQPSATPRPTPRPTVTPTPTPEAVRGPLTLWAAVPQEAAPAFQMLIDDLARTHGIAIRITIKDSDAIISDVRARLLTDQPLPDLVWGSQTDLRQLQALGVLQPANDALEARAVVPAVADMAVLDGVRWGTSLGAQRFLLLLSNQKLVTGMPQTSDDLIAQARRLNGRDQHGIVAGWAESRWLLAWLSGMGGGVLGPDRQPTLDTPAMVATLNLLRELRAAGPPPPSTYLQGVALFQKGQAAFAIDGDWALTRYRQFTETLELGIAPLPLVNATGRPAVPPLDGVYLMYGVALRGERLTQANAIGRVLTEPPQQARIARDLGILPALRATLRDPAVAQNPALAAAATTALQAAALPGGPAADCIWNAIERTLPEVLLGERSAEEGAARMQDLAVSCVRATR